MPLPDVSTFTTVELLDLADQVRTEIAKRNAQQQLEEDVRASVERAKALGLDSTTVSTTCGSAVTDALAE